MTAIKDYSDAVNAKLDEIGTSVDTLTAGITGVSEDVTFLKDIITKLQNNPGPISAEDQALLDAGVARVTALSEKVAPLAEAIAALDAATDSAPTPPPAP